jgi:hypothetical protein
MGFAAIARSLKISENTARRTANYNGREFWIPKPRINRIRLKNNTFEIYTKEGTVE